MIDINKINSSINNSDIDVYNDEILYDCELKINGISIDYSQIKKIKISDPLFDNSNDMFTLGQFVSKKVEIDFKNMANIPLEGNVELNIILDKQGTILYIPIGKFIIEYSPEDYYNNCKLTCLDYAVKMKTNVDYSELIVSTDEQGNETITPITLETLLIWLCEYYEIELGTYPNTNKDYLISVYDTSMSGKYYISLIAELMGGFAHIDRYGKLCIIPLKQEVKETIDGTASKSWTSTSRYEISRVVYDDGTINAEAGDTTKNTLYIRNENMFVNDNAQELIENIYNEVNGVIIDSIKCSNKGNILLDSYDYIKYELDDEEYYTFNNVEITYEQSIMSTNETNVPTKIQEETTNIITTDSKYLVRKIKREIDQENLEIRSTISELEINDDSLNDRVSGIENSNVVINGQLSQFSQRLDKFEFRVVDSLTNNMVTIDIDGIKVATNISAISTLMTNNAFLIKNYETELLKLDENGGKMENLTVKTYFTAGVHRREKFHDDEFGVQTGEFFVGEGE